MTEFNDSQPIYLQIRQRIIELILGGRLDQDRALPSVRQIATDLSVNPLTVTRAYQSLVDLGVVETRRGLGMFATQGARKTLLEHERSKFLSDEWPRILHQIEQLGLDAKNLLQKEAKK
jgi:DNA-binding transcriptional regulator YhcF (GntR family)